MIFEHASARNTKPKRALQYWFENKDVKDQIAAYTANDPNGPAPQVVMDNRMGQLDEPDSEDEVEPDYQDNVDDDDDSEDEEDEADDNEQDEDEEGEDDEAQDQDAAADEEDMDAQDDEADENEAEGDIDMGEPDGIAADSTPVTTAQSGHAEVTTASDQAVEGATEEDEDDQMDDGESENDGENDDGEGENDGEASTTATATQQLRRPLKDPSSRLTANGATSPSLCASLSALHRPSCSSSTSKSARKRRIGSTRSQSSKSTPLRVSHISASSRSP
jgi:hypothetical protein